MWLTWLLSLLGFALVLAVWLKARPSYRVNRGQVLRLLDLVLSNQANLNDWLAFTSVPIYYDPRLEAIRRRCQVLEETELLGGSSAHLFTQRGLAQLRAIRAELNALPT